MATGTNIPESEATRKLREAEEAKNQGNPNNTNLQIVEKIVEVEVYPPDVKKLIENARSEEKQKLYDRIKRADAVESENVTLKARMSDLEKQVGTLTADLQTLLAEAEEADSKGKSKKNDGTDVNKVIADTAAAVRKEMSAENQVLRDEIASLRSQGQQTSLSTYRDQIIASAGGRICAAMVRGNTKEELDVSVVEAKAEYERIVKSVGGNVASQSASQTASALSNQVPSANGVQPAAPTPVGRGEPTYPGSDGTQGLPDDQKLAQEVRGLTPEQYREKRTAIRQRLRTTVDATANPVTRR